MFGIGMPELLLILVVALIVIGPKKLPDLARAVGRGFAEFKKATEELKNSLREETRTSETREQLTNGNRFKISPPSSPSPCSYEDNARVADAGSESGDRQPPKDVIHGG